MPFSRAFQLTPRLRSDPRLSAEVEEVAHLVVRIDQVRVDAGRGKAGMAGGGPHFHDATAAVEGVADEGMAAVVDRQPGSGARVPGPCSLP